MSLWVSTQLTSPILPGNLPRKSGLRSRYSLDRFSFNTNHKFDYHVAVSYIKTVFMKNINQKFYLLSDMELESDCFTRGTVVRPEGRSSDRLHHSYTVRYST